MGMVTVCMKYPYVLMKIDGTLVLKLTNDTWPNLLTIIICNNTRNSSCILYRRV